MKRYISLLLVLAIALVVNVSTIRAEDSSSSNTSGNTKTNLTKEARLKALADFKAKRDALEMEIKTKREEFKQKMEDLKSKIKLEKDKAKAKIEEARIVGRENALQRFDAAVLRMSNLKDRVKTQITKLITKGVNVTDAQNLVVIAETKLTAAKAKIADANALLANSTNELSKDQKTKLRTLAQEIQTLVKDIHQTLNAAIKSLKNQLKIEVWNDKDIKNSTSTSASPKDN